MKGTIEDCVLPELYQYEKVVKAVEKGLVDMGYDKGLAVNYAPKLTNSFFDWVMDRYEEQIYEPELKVDKIKILKDTVAGLHKKGVYVTLDDYVELRHEFDKMRKAFSGRD